MRTTVPRCKAVVSLLMRCKTHPLRSNFPLLRSTQSCQRGLKARQRLVEHGGFEAVWQLGLDVGHGLRGLGQDFFNQ